MKVSGMPVEIVMMVVIVMPVAMTVSVVVMVILEKQGAG